MSGDTAEKVAGHALGQPPIPELVTRRIPHEQRVAFYIPSGAAGGTRRAHIAPAPLDCPATVELIVAAGGPVFLWLSRVDEASAFSRIHGTGAGGQLTATVQPDFDLCASGTAKADMGINAVTGQITVASDNESIGIVVIREKII